MAVNFTNSPSNGATITADGRTYTFSSSTGKWDVTASPGDTLLSLTDVGSDGTNGQVLTTDGSGSFTFTTPSSGGLASVVADTTPQLGGSLDVNGQGIVSVSNGNISIAPNGSGKVILDGLSWPTADGTANYVLKTDGSGNLSWTAQSSSGGGASVSTSDTAPSSPSDGDLWFDTTELTPYIYYADGSSNQWVEFANPDSGAATSLAIADLSDVSSTSPSSGQVLKWSGSEWAPAADNEGASAGTLTATASGALSNGDLIIINSDGTVSAVAQSGTSASTGSPTIFEDSTTTLSVATFDSNSNKVVVAYLNEYNKGTAVVGTVSGTSISFGTPVVFENAATSVLAATFDSNANKVVIGYRDDGNSNYGTAIVGTVSGTSISFGTPVVFNSGSTQELEATFDSNLNKVVFIYRDIGNSSYGTAIVGTVSGTSISFGSETVFYSGITIKTALCFDSTNNKVIVAYRAHTNTHTRCRVGEISGTSISFPSGHATFNGNDAIEYTQLVHDSSNEKTVLIYRDTGNSNYGTAVVGTVSGTTISFGSEVVFSSYTADYISAHYASNINKVVIGYKGEGGTNYAYAIAGTVSGTSISFGTPVTFATTNVLDIGNTYDSNEGKSVFPYTDYTDDVEGKAVALQIAGSTSTNLTATNYIGIADAAYSNSATATIQVVGSVDDAQSGLTPGQAYYVQTDGSLSTTAGSPSVLAGTAVSASKLIIKG